MTPGVSNVNIYHAFIQVEENYPRSKPNLRIRFKAPTQLKSKEASIDPHNLTLNLSFDKLTKLINLSANNSVKLSSDLFHKEPLAKPQDFILEKSC